VQRGDENALNQYIEYGYDIDKIKDGYTLLHCAMLLNKTKLVDTLLEHKANVNKLGPEGDTALLNGVMFTKPAIIQQLLKHHADVSIRDHVRNNAIFYAVGGNPENIYLLANAGGDINNVNNNGATPLLRAVDYEEVTHRGYVTVTLLLSLGAKVEGTNLDGKTPLAIAMEHNDTNVVRLLEQHLQLPHIKPVSSQ